MSSHDPSKDADRDAADDEWLAFSLSIASTSRPPTQREPQLLNLFPMEEPPQPQPQPPVAAQLHPLVAALHPYHDEEMFAMPPPPPPPRPPPSPPPASNNQDEIPRSADLPLQEDETRQSRKRKLRLTEATKKGKLETIEPPFPWAASTRATIHSREYLLAHNIKSVRGTVICQGCNEQYEIEFNWEEKLREVVKFVVQKKLKMHDRAPKVWMDSVLPNCNRCGKEKALKPLITKKRSVNWLFLLLGQMIGCCTLAQLKYFCKHRDIHYTAAKNRLVYLTYLDLFKQLEPRATTFNS